MSKCINNTSMHFCSKVFKNHFFLLPKLFFAGSAVVPWRLSKKGFLSQELDKCFFAFFFPLIYFGYLCLDTHFDTYKEVNRNHISRKVNFPKVFFWKFIFPLLMKWMYAISSDLGHVNGISFTISHIWLLDMSVVDIICQNPEFVKHESTQNKKNLLFKEWIVWYR